MTSTELISNELEAFVHIHLADVRTRAVERAGIARKRVIAATTASKDGLFARDASIATSAGPATFTPISATPRRIGEARAIATSTGGCAP